MKADGAVGLFGVWARLAVRPPLVARHVVRGRALALASAARPSGARRHRGLRRGVGRLPLFDGPSRRHTQDRISGHAVPAPASQCSALLAWACHLRLPAVELWHGFLFLKAHSAHGHAAFLCEKISEHGFWNFYLVGLLLKSPLPFLALLAVSAATLFWRASRVALDPAGLGAGLAVLTTLALSMALAVNIGVRHVLVVVPLLAIFIASAIAPWIEGLGSRRRVIAGTALTLLLAAEVATVQAACPQLMAYFNPLAGREPGHALIDSDLDWGQDFLLLKRELRARQISLLHYGFFGTVNPCGPDMPKLLPLVPRTPVTGWIVLSEQFYHSNVFVSIRRAWVGHAGLIGALRAKFPLSAAAV